MNNIYKIPFKWWHIFVTDMYLLKKSFEKVENRRRLYEAMLASNSNCLCHKFSDSTILNQPLGNNILFYDALTLNDAICYLPELKEACEQHPNFAGFREHNVWFYPTAEQFLKEPTGLSMRKAVLENAISLTNEF